MAKKRHYKTAICAIIKDEQRYLKEWIDYHLEIGIDSIYLFEDYGSRSHASIVSGYDSVHLSNLSAFGVPDYHYSKNQEELYGKFLTEQKTAGEYDWLLFTDIDEFLTFEDGWNLQRLEEYFADKPAVLLAWEQYGANGHIRRPEGSVMENYTEVVPCIEKHVMWTKKSLVNVQQCSGFKNLHIAIGSVDTTGNGDLDADRVYDKAWLRHYFTKSWEDFCVRIFERGNQSNNFRTLDNFFAANPSMRHMERELIESVRYRHCKNTQWLSKKYKLISGGNLGGKIEEVAGMR